MSDYEIAVGWCNRYRRREGGEQGWASWSESVCSV